MSKGGSAKTNPQVVACSDEEVYEGAENMILEPDRPYHSSPMLDLPAHTRAKQCVVLLRFRSNVASVPGVLPCRIPVYRHVKRELHYMQWRL